MPATRPKWDMFGQIARDIFRVLGVSRTAVQCETRFKTLAKRKRSEDKNNRTSGRAPCHVSYEEEFAAIKAIDDSLEPEVLRGVNKVLYKTTSSTASNGRSCRSTQSNSDLENDGEAANIPPGASPEEISTGQEVAEMPMKKRKADRNLRASLPRTQHMALFFEEMRKMNEEKEQRKEERERRREERHQELLTAHARHMAAIQELLKKDCAP
ncbi:hypothetical protein HPB48_010189 [Haemaphysalis longicornis]|uniref:Myb-like domain-containing protein n=1 Tax=Haemaphysalis longicornis TaxID=44386 RepID=A0A9J6FVX6_HAELO|nr:hypothetical protein HPB48_010189 [Haemaphysalis longicornis]